MTNSEKNNKLIAEFLGYKVDWNVGDWSEYNSKSLTEHWNNNNKTFVHVPKGSGEKWYKVKHRDKFYQLFTDFTFCKLSENDLELGYSDDAGEYVLLKNSLFHSSWDWLMLAVNKIESLGYYTNADMDFTGKDNETIMHFFRVYKNGYHGINVGFGKSKSKLESVYTAIIEFIKWYNNANSNAQ